MKGYGFFRRTLVALLLSGYLVTRALAQAETTTTGNAAVAPTAVSASAAVKLAAETDIKAEFVSVPCKNGQRLEAVKALFERLGAAPTDLTVERLKNVENLVVTKLGKSTEKLVIGAHYDMAGAGCGAVDNWTGIVALAQLYRSLKDVPTEKTLVFVAFGREEEGLIGSAAMAKQIPKEELPRYCGMLNLDSFGVAIPQVMRNTSSTKLETLAKTVAEQMKLPFASAAIEGANADSSSFLARKIPALTLHGLNGDWPKLLHSSNDQANRVNAQSVYLGYRLALSVLIRMDEAACAAFR